MRRWLGVFSRERMGVVRRSVRREPPSRCGDPVDRRDERLNQAAFVGCTALAAWSLAAYVLASPVEEFVASQWARFLTYAALLMAPVSLRILSHLTGRPGRRAVIAAETAAIALAALTAAGLVVVGAAPNPAASAGSAWQAVPGPLGWLLGAYVLSVVGVSVLRWRVTPARAAASIVRGRATSSSLRRSC
jgi:hypothetical protein